MTPFAFYPMTQYDNDATRRRRRSRRISRRRAPPRPPAPASRSVVDSPAATLSRYYFSTRGIINDQGRDIFVFVRLRGAARALVRSTLPLAVLLASLARGTQAQSLRPFEWVPAGGIHFMGPLRASVSGGVLGVFYEGRGEEAVLAQIEAGLGGAKIRGGIASTQAFLTGFTIEGTMLRTFGNPVGADRWRTYAGGEVHGIFVLLNVGVGLYAPVGGGGRTLHTITLGLGL